MYEFNFNRPASVADALAAMADSDDGQFMAGGQTMIPVLKQRLAMPSDVVELAKIDDLKGIAVAGDKVTIGAMTPHAEVHNSADVVNAIPALADLAGMIGDPHVRNRGTIGGSVANNDPAADYPAAVVGLGATVVTDRREISGDDFFVDLFETALVEGELIIAVEFPVPDKAAYIKFPNPASRYAIVGVFVSQSDGDVRVAVTGAGPCVFRELAMETALAADFSADSISRISVLGDNFNNDIHASAEYRAHLVTVMAKRAVIKAG